MSKFEVAIVGGAFTPQLVKTRGRDMKDGEGACCAGCENPVSVFALSGNAKVYASFDFRVEFCGAFVRFAQCVNGAAPCAKEGVVRGVAEELLMWRKR